MQELSGRSLKSKKLEGIEVKLTNYLQLQAPKGRCLPAEGAALGIRDLEFGEVKRMYEVKEVNEWGGKRSYFRS
jgi:hypothetical protein